MKNIKNRIARAFQKLTQAPIVINETGTPMKGGFIIAPFRSGTTLLRMILDSHPEIASPPETYILHHLLAPLKEERIIEAMWNLGYQRETLAKTLGNCSRQYFEGYAKSKEKSVWIEKTPSYVELLPEIRESMPHVVFIMLYRHPFDIIQSSIDRNMLETQMEIMPYKEMYTDSFAAYCHYVNNQHSLMLSFQEKNPEICHSIHYESLTSVAENEMKKICHFIGIAYDKSMLDFSKKKHDSGLGDHKIYKTDKIQKSNANYTKWTDKQVEIASGILSKNLEKLGYKH